MIKKSLKFSAYMVATVCAVCIPLVTGFRTDYESVSVQVLRSDIAEGDDVIIPPPGDIGDAADGGDSGDSGDDTDGGDGGDDDDDDDDG